MLIWILVFVATMITDALWTVCVSSIAKNQKYKASISSMLLALFAGAMVLLYVYNPWLLIPQALGGGLGTYLTVVYQAKKRKI